MALDGIPPPPNLAPPVPGSAAALSEEARAAVEALRDQLAGLQQRLAAGENVQPEIDALYAHHYNNWKRASDEQRRLEANLEAIKTDLANVRQAAEADTAKLNAIYTKTSLEIETLQTQLQEPVLMAYPQLIQDIRELIQVKTDDIADIPAEIQRITDENRARIQDLDNQSKVGSPLAQELRRYKQEEVAPLKALKDVFPVRFQRGGAAAPARVFNLREWYDQGIISGIFYENLKKFIIKEEHVRDSEVQEKYTPELVLKQYAEFLKLRSLRDERDILGIATGYISRDFGNLDTRYFINNLRPLDNVVYKDEYLPLLENRLAALYNINADLRASAPVTLNGPAAGGIVAVASSIQQFVDGAQVRQGAAGHRVVASSSNSSSSSSSSSAAAVPANRRDRFAELDARTQQAFQQGNDLQATAGPIAQRGGPRNLANLAHVQLELQRVNEQFEGFLGFADSVIAESARRIADLLGVEAEATPEVMMQKMEEEVIKLKDKAETPETILSNEWAQDKSGAFTHAYECYSKKQGRKPDMKEMGTWSQSIPRSDLPVFRDLLRKYAR